MMSTDHVVPNAQQLGVVQENKYFMMAARVSY